MSEKSGGIVFIVGGAKSGKSSFALAKAETFAGRKAFIATAESLDDEMKERIQRHRDQRGENWETFEEPKEMARVLKEVKVGYSAALIDCLTLWLSNLLHSRQDPDREIAFFLSALREGGHPPFFIVSNEVGMGIVPENALARRFRDLAGRLNQEVAAIADEVYLVTAGIPLRIKS
jgi:adenosylcobinamide kinase/adenosylcobinamide-phosphate guanylyltransferase